MTNGNLLALRVPKGLAKPYNQKGGHVWER
jgi:hypothetical protein